MRRSHKVDSLLARNRATPVTATTDSVAPQQRAEFWGNALTRVLKSKAWVEVPSTVPLDAKIIGFAWGSVHLIEMIATPHTITLTPSPGDDSIFVLINLDGNARAVQGEREARLSAGSFCVFDGTQLWSITLIDPTRNAMLIMPGKQLREIFPDWPQLTGVQIPGSEGAPAIFFDLIASLCRHRDTIKEESAAEIAVTIIDSLAAALRSFPQYCKAPPSHLETYHKERIRNYVKTQLRDPNLSVESVALEVGLSSRYIHRLFTTEVMPLMKWVWMERLDHCCRDLSLGSMRNRSVSEIAFYWGFNNPAHFSRAFRNRFGQSPTDYRRQAVPAAQSTSLTAGATVITLNRPAQGSPIDK
jgi:AraC-like DNA-binding protein